jgi:hypothetical protein
MLAGDYRVQVHLHNSRPLSRQPLARIEVILGRENHTGLCLR